MPTLEIKNLRVRSLDTHHNEVSWETGGYEDPRDYTCVMQRSESPAGPFDPISPPFEDRYIFIDSRLPQGDKFRELYYRMAVTSKAANTTVLTEAVAREAAPDLFASYVRVNELVLFTQVIGRRVWLFKVRTFGPRCTCVDRATGQRIRSNCRSCFNRGFLRGFHDPIEVWMQIDPSAKSVQHTATQSQQQVMTAARLPFYPAVVPGDVIVEAENKRWTVESVQQTERLRAVCRQELTLRQIELTDVEYQLPINLDRALRDLMISPVRMFTNPTNIEESVDSEIPDVFANYQTYPKDLTKE